MVLILEVDCRVPKKTEFQTWAPEKFVPTWTCKSLTDNTQNCHGGERAKKFNCPAQCSSTIFRFALPERRYEPRSNKGAARDGQVGGELCNFYAENGTREDGLLWTEGVNPKAESGCRND